MYNNKDERRSQNAIKRARVKASCIELERQHHEKRASCSDCKSEAAPPELVATEIRIGAESKIRSKLSCADIRRRVLDGIGPASKIGTDELLSSSLVRANKWHECRLLD